MKARHVLRSVVQQAAVRALRREFTAGEGGEKLEAYIQASSWLRASHVTFNHLKRIPAGRSGMHYIHPYSSFIQWLPACRIIHQFCPIQSVGKPYHKQYRYECWRARRDPRHPQLMLTANFDCSCVVTGRAFSLCQHRQDCR